MYDSESRTIGPMPYVSKMLSCNEQTTINRYFEIKLAVNASMHARPSQEWSARRKRTHLERMRMGEREVEMYLLNSTHQMLIKKIDQGDQRAL